MAQSQDTEITLGTGKMLFLFFGLVALCSVFFAVGFRLGKATSPAGPDQTATAGSANSGARPSASKTPQTTDLTFYKSVGQDNPAAQLAPKDTSTATTPDSQSPTPADPMNSPTATGYVVQVAAVSKQEDAEALVDALKKKQYAASGALLPDKLYHVQIGPFGDIKDAEATRAKLVGDGYNPILKK
jgi:DedD protein